MIAHSEPENVGSNLTRSAKIFSLQQKAARNEQRKALAESLEGEDRFCAQDIKNLANGYEMIIFEDLNVMGIVKNHSLASGIMNFCWYKLRQLTVYKAERHG